MIHIQLRRLMPWLLAAVMAVGMVGCSEKDLTPRETNINPERLLGKWVEDGTETYWRYRDDYTGVSWDEAEDITEEESNMTFSWELNSGELTHVFTGRNGNQAVPKTYGVIELTAKRMVWEDDYGRKTVLLKQ